jgi:hypothetical protein
MSRFVFDIDGADSVGMVDDRSGVYLHFRILAQVLAGAREYCKTNRQLCIAATDLAMNLSALRLHELL